MTEPEIVRQKEYIESRINYWEEQLFLLQNDVCEHNNAIKQYGADTGNYCVSDDSYWRDIFCQDCGYRAKAYRGEDGYLDK